MQLVVFLCVGILGSLSTGVQAFITPIEYIEESRVKRFNKDINSFFAEYTVETATPKTDEKSNELGSSTSTVTATATEQAASTTTGAASALPVSTPASTVPSAVSAEVPVAVPAKFRFTYLRELNLAVLETINWPVGKNLQMFQNLNTFENGIPFIWVQSGQIIGKGQKKITPWLGQAIHPSLKWAVAALQMPNWINSIEASELLDEGGAVSGSDSKNAKTNTLNARTRIQKMGESMNIVVPAEAWWLSNIKDPQNHLFNDEVSQIAWDRELFNPTYWALSVTDSSSVSRLLQIEVDSHQKITASDYKLPEKGSISLNDVFFWEYKVEKIQQINKESRFVKNKVNKEWAKWPGEIKLDSAPNSKESVCNLPNIPEVSEKLVEAQMLEFLFCHVF